ncbi:MAG: type II toxin-antitoxin system HipA family toxin [Gemmatimonas sp.]|jgi:serine/threonine-protein kinase HipA
MTDRDAKARRRASRRRRTQYTTARIDIWGQQVGAVAEDENGQITVELTDTFRGSGLEISPVHLPLSQKGPMRFPELQRSAAFAGLPGVLADCLPDAFGNAVIRRYFEQRGMPDAALSPVQRLLYIGSRAMGALEFSPALKVPTSDSTETALEVARLVEEARRVIEGDASVVVPEMMQVGGSAGGARAKALVLWDRQRNVVKSAFAQRAASDEHWLIKFDGVSGNGGGHALQQAFAPGPYGRTEYAYSRMARSAGIDMSETHLLAERDFAHFMTRRFDRDGEERVHLHSLGGMLHVDYNIAQALSYEDYLRLIRRLGMQQGEIEQVFRRMVFNVIARNQDDHVKNFGFLMGRDGRWRLAPAFDMTWAYGSAWTARHQMTVNGKSDDFVRADLLAVGEKFDLRDGGETIIQQVEQAVHSWDTEARDAGLDATWIADLATRFRRLQ